MSARTVPSMAQRGGGGPSSPWQRPTSIGNGRQESRPSNNSRGYSVPMGTNKSYRPNVETSTPPQRRQGWGETRNHSSSSYRRNDPNSNHNRERERDQQYHKYHNDRRNPNEFRTNGYERGFERGHRPHARYNDEYDSGKNNANRGRGYENNYENNMRPMDDGGWNRNLNRNDRAGSYQESREFSSYNSNPNNAKRREMMGGGSNHHYEDDRRGSNLRNDGLRNHSRDFGREYERGFKRNGEKFDYQQHQQQDRSHSETNGFRDYHPQNKSEDYPSLGREDRFGYNQNANFGRKENKEGNDQYQQSSRQHDKRWEAPITTSTRERYRYDKNDNYGFTNHRTGMGERHWEGAEPRSGEGRGYAMNDKSRLDCSVQKQTYEYFEKQQNCNNRAWGTREQRERNSQSANSHDQRSSEYAAPRVDDKRCNVEKLGDRSSSVSGNNHENNERKRQREGKGEEPISSSMASELDPTENASSTFRSDSIETKLKHEFDQNKKAKLATATAAINVSSTPSTSKQKLSNQRIDSKMPDLENSTKIGIVSNVVSSTIHYGTVPTPSSETKTHDKPRTKEIPIKSASSSSVIKKHQIQAKPKSKPINKFGIPMRWLKPKAKPKVLVKKTPLKAPDDTSKSIKIPLKQFLKKSESRPSSPSNRLVTDSSEDGLNLSSSKDNKNANVSSSAHAKKENGTSVPSAIVTKKKAKKISKATNKHKTQNDVAMEEPEDEWDSEAESEESDGGEGSDSESDDDEVPVFASKMLGVPKSPSSIQRTDSKDSLELGYSENERADEASKVKSPKLKIRLSAALKHKLNESKQCNNEDRDNGLSEEDGNKLEDAFKKLERRKKKREKEKALTEKIVEQKPAFDHEKAKLEIEEERRKREEAKPLTAKELRKILKDDNFSGGGNQNNWVRRSRRQPNRNLLNSKPVRVLVDKLKYNDIDMRVLKMKKYINDPNTPCAVIDAILNAMEENTNCEALYIQNFNEGMRDEQVIHLLRILQQPSCKIWCLNIGENYNVSDATWERFTKGLIHTKITHMYASEHTITADMKDEIRFTIRENRKKHDMHINPNNLDVIIQCTHCWWNPINAKVLRPFIKKKGYEHVLKDKEGQGLQGSNSMAPTS